MWKREGRKKGERTKQGKLAMIVVNKNGWEGKQNLEEARFFFESLPGRGDERVSKSTTEKAERGERRREMQQQLVRRLKSREKRRESTPGITPVPCFF